MSDQQMNKPHSSSSDIELSQDMHALDVFFPSKQKHKIYYNLCNKSCLFRVRYNVDQHVIQNIVSHYANSGANSTCSCTKWFLSKYLQVYRTPKLSS